MTNLRQTLEPKQYNGLFNHAICGRFAAFGLRRFDMYKNERKVQYYYDIL